MSKSTLTPINLLSASADPTLPTLKTGDIYFNTTSGVFKIYNGTNWLTMTAMLVLGPSTSIPAGTPAGTVIIRTAV